MDVFNILMQIARGALGGLLLLISSRLVAFLDPAIGELWIVEAAGIGGAAILFFCAGAALVVWLGNRDSGE